MLARRLMWRIEVGKGEVEIGTGFRELRLWCIGGNGHGGCLVGEGGGVGGL